MSVFVDSRAFPASIAKLAPRFVEVALVIAMAWVASGWFVGGTPMAPLGGHAGTTASITTPSAKEIAAVPLFGKAAVKAAPKAAPVVKVTAPSRLTIRLLGTVVAGESSAAVLSLKLGGEQKVFFLNDSIQPGVVLKTVEAEAIVVDNHGRMERIAMAKSALPVSPPVTVEGAADKHNMDISRATLDAQLNDLPKLLTQAKAIPHQMDGKVDGFMVNEIVPGSLYAQAGLQNGDVIRKIDGKPVTRMDQGIEMFQALRDRNSIDIEVLRGASVRNLHYTIR